jgi:hypothetical protein
MVADGSRTLHYESDDNRTVIPDPDIAARSEESPLNHIFDTLICVVQMLP